METSIATKETRQGKGMQGSKELRETKAVKSELGTEHLFGVM
jgi:hypothetical protein